MNSKNDQVQPKFVQLLSIRSENELGHPGPLKYSFVSFCQFCVFRVANRHLDNKRTQVDCGCVENNTSRQSSLSEKFPCCSSLLLVDKLYCNSDLTYAKVMKAFIFAVQNTQCLAGLSFSEESFDARKRNGLCNSSFGICSRTENCIVKTPQQ